MRIANANVITALTPIIVMPINTSAIDKFPTAFRNINGIGAVRGKNDKKRTRPESGDDTNNDAA